MFIRAVHKSQKKKINGQGKPTFDFLMKELVRCFGDAVKQSDIGYYDEDQEFIRLTNQEEWEICIEETQIKNKGKEVLTVEVHLLPKDSNSEHSQVSDCTKSFIAAPMLDTTKSDIQDWKVIDKADELQNTLPEPIMFQSMSAPTEPSIFDDPVEEDKPIEATPVESFTNTSQSDILVDIKVTGTPEELERIQRTVIHQFAPQAGFEVDKCEVLVKRECPDSKEEADSILENGSQISHMTNELRDEIETLIEEKLKKLSIFKPEEPKKMTKKESPTKISCGNYIHRNVTCDNCRKEIVGCARYKSLVKRDFDLCENCEATGIHPEPMIKIRNPIGMRVGLRLNSQYEVLKSLFVEEPSYVQVSQLSHPLCHIRRTNEEKLEKIAKAEQTLKTSVNTPKIETPIKMEEEKLPVKTPSLCHIRTTPKVEEKKPIQASMTCAPKEEIIETPKRVENGMLSILSRIFPHQETKVISEFLSKNEGLSLEDIVNKFMDAKF